MQPALITPRPDATPNRMSSREVAELTGKRHDNVLRDIREMIDVLHSSNLSFVCESAYYTAGNGQRYEMLQMDRPTVECLVTGYDPVSRMKVIQRLHFLEERQQAQIIALPQTFAQALRALAESVEEKEVLQLQIIEQQPAVEFHKEVGDSKAKLTMAKVAKLLKWGQNRLFDFLRDAKVLMSDAANWNTPYQEFIDRKYFEIKIVTWKDKRGETRIYMKTVVTTKGLNYIMGLLPASS